MRALDAAFPFDREAKLRQAHAAAQRLKIGIVGFGTFGQFLAKRMVQAGHEVRRAGGPRRAPACIAGAARLPAGAARGRSGRRGRRRG